MEGTDKPPALNVQIYHLILFKVVIKEIVMNNTLLSTLEQDLQDENFCGTKCTLCGGYTNNVPNTYFLGLES